MQLFGTKKQKFLYCPGTTGQAQNLATGQAGTAFQNPGEDVGQDGTITIIFLCYEDISKSSYETLQFAKKYPGLSCLLHGSKKITRLATKAE